MIFSELKGCDFSDKVNPKEQLLSKRAKLINACEPYCPKAKIKKRLTMHIISHK